MILLFYGIGLRLGIVLMLIVLRLLLRSQIAAIAASIFLVALFFAGNDLLSCAIGLSMSACIIFLLMRFGLAALVFFGFFFMLFLEIPTTLDTSARYFGYSLAALAVFAVVVLCSFRFSLSGRRLLAPSRLDE